MTKFWFYNGNDIAPGQSGGDLGTAYGDDPHYLGRGERLTPRSANAIQLADYAGKRLCCPVIVGDEIYLYYEGYDNTRWQVFLEIYGLNGGIRGRPLYPVIPNALMAGTHSLQRPAVLYEPWDTGAEFKAVLSRGVNVADATELVAAVSSDGINWTILGTMFGLGIGWESAWLTSSGGLINDNGTYRLFYSGKGGSPLRWKSGMASRGGFGASGWTRAGPILNPRGAALPLTATINPTSNLVDVSSTADYDVGAPVLVGNGLTSCEWNEIIEKVSGEQLRMKYKFLGGYPSGSSVCAQIHSGSVDLSQVWFEDSKWKAVFTCFEFFLNIGYETVGYAETDDLANGFTIDPTAWPLPMPNKLVSWDRTSAENFKFVLVP